MNRKDIGRKEPGAGFRRTMRGALVVAGACATMLESASAHALLVTSAEVKNAAIEVKGKEAAPGATIKWESEVVGQADDSGKFKFFTTNRPADCVGEVSDEVESVSAVVRFCGGPPGPSGVGLVHPVIAGKDSTQRIPNGGDEAVFVVFDVIDSTRGFANSDGVFDPLTGTYTAPEAGFYSFTTNVEMQTQENTGFGSQFSLMLAVNPDPSDPNSASDFRFVDDVFFNDPGLVTYTCHGTVLVKLAAGDTIRFIARLNKGGVVLGGGNFYAGKVG